MPEKWCILPFFYGVMTSSCRYVMIVILHGSTSDAPKIVFFNLATSTLDLSDGEIYSSAELTS